MRSIWKKKLKTYENREKKESVDILIDFHMLMSATMESWKDIVIGLACTQTIIRTSPEVKKI